MATGQSILDRIRREKAARRPGVLPLIAFYGREAEQEQLRNRFYEVFERAMRDDVVLPPQPERRALLLLDFDTSIGVLDANASPVEWLVYRGELEADDEEEGMASVRFHAALRFRDMAAGAQVNGMKSPSLSGLGGGGGGAVDISGFQLDCMKHLQRVRTAMPAPWLFGMLEAVVVLDDWLDLRNLRAGAAAERRRGQTLTALRYALDIAAAHLGYQTGKAPSRRWPDGPPPMPASLKGHKRGPLALTRVPVPPR